MAKIFVSQPGIGGNVHQKCLMTMQRMTNDHNLSFQFIENCSLITKARQDHFGMFLKSDCDYLLSVDADLVITPPGCLDDMIKKCPPNSIIGGLYAMKALDPETGHSPTNGVPLNKDEKIVLNGSVVKMKYIPTGFMLVPRPVAKKLAEFYKELAYKDSRLKATLYAVYNTMLIDVDDHKEFLPEDFSFCERCRAAGIDIYADTGIILGHIGPYLYSLQHLIPPHETL